MRYLFSSLLVLLLASTSSADDVVIVSPTSVRLQGPGAVYSLLLDAKGTNGIITDVTGSGRFRSRDAKVAAVTESGLVRAVGDGSTVIDIEVQGHKLAVPVVVEGTKTPRTYHFENDITPLLNRFGCNSSGCHGNAEGQNGFKLSIFGFDPAFDYSALVKESRGRRVFVGAPDASLFLAKASGSTAHGGGVRIARDTPEYETLRGWIAAGVPFGDPKAPRVASIRMEPAERQLGKNGQQQLRVLARTSDGREMDVTHHARFQSNNDALASVNPFGLVSAGDVPGEAAIMASFMGRVEIFRALIPRPEKIALSKVTGHNFIDEHVHAKLTKLNIAPSDVCSDSEYLRRVYLDIIGTLPTPAEARRFLDNKEPDRRAKLVDELLERSEYADYWALKWADLLRVDRQALGHKRAFAYYRWIRESLAANKPYDQFVRELLTAEGPLDQVGPANFFKVVQKPGDAASTLSQVFLGVRIACAECHHHPFDRWSQTDYFGMQAFFTPVGVKNTPAKQEFVLAGGDPLTKHPRTGETIHAHALATLMPEKSMAGDRRAVLADWMTQPDNPWFAANLANRLWAHFLGRGLVEPVDDVRATNPPTNPELLDALAKHIVKSKFDVKQTIRAITVSRTYQLSARPNATNEKDEQNYSRALFRRLDAEVLLDMVSQTTGVPEKFHGLPSGYRAIQLWDSKVTHYFLKVFGRPMRATACECERNQAPSVSQVLHLLNAPEIHNKLTHEAGTVARLARTMKDDGALVDELYLTCYSRLPDARERGVALDYLRRDPAKRRQAAEDLAWSLMNTLEFLFNH